MVSSKRDKVSFLVSFTLHALALIALGLGGGNNHGDSKEKNKGKGEANKYKGVEVKSVIPKERVVEISIVEPTQPEILTKKAHEKKKIKKLKPIKKKKLKKQNKSVKKECPGAWYGGIGIQESYNKLTGVTTITDVFPGYPADIAGLMAGDIIVSADQPQIIGDPGTKLTMQIMRGNIVFVIVVTRGKVCY